MSRARALTALIAVTWLAVAGCDCSDETLATLTHRQRTVDRNGPRGRWTRATIGDRFELGDAVRTGPRSTADLEVVRGSGLRLSENTTVRFARNAARRRGGLRLAVDTGQVEIEAADEEIWIETELGALRIDPSSRVRLTGGGGIRVQVVTGAALFDPAEGDDQRLAAGSSTELAETAAAPTAQRDGGSFAIAPDGGAAAPAADGGAATGIAVQLRSGDAQVREAGQDAFRPLAPGATSVTPGTLLRLAGGAQANVRRGTEEAALTGPTEVVVAPSEASLLRANHGSTSASATRADVRVEVPGGSIVLRHGGTRTRVAVGQTTTEITPERGTVAVDTAAQDVNVVPGQRAVLTRDGAVTIVGVATGPADVAIVAGESAVIHDPGAPTGVRVQFGSSCPGLGTVEVTGGRRVAPVSGTQAAVVRLALGVWEYRLRCAAPDGSPGEATARGTITVRGDSGSTPPARRIAHNVLDADGRNYTVLYQNLLPSITLRWSDAPPTSGFTLHVKPQGGGGARTVPTGAASHTFGSGEIAEGRYQFWFESSAGVRSPTTQLRLGFDNAAPAATIRDVAANDGNLRVQGLVEPGWSVTVNGEALTLDGHNRFSADLAPDREGRSVAIRLEKPGRGVHYYVRRVGGASP